MCSACEVCRQDLFLVLEDCACFFFSVAVETPNVTRLSVTGHKRDTTSEQPQRNGPSALYSDSFSVQFLEFTTTLSRGRDL